ncbi:hypothetical protein GL263_17865 [Streptomyces durbertensis]|uniref:Secreted protein n=1 Tax=Streptomyces durbertensis TaxID=2448886 RepID=A0ABR6EKD9_9ACTN|nr:hypothetical protein [Streptomyces durbertensis]
MPHPTASAQGGPARSALRARLAALRGPGRAPRPMDSRALAALAANPGCDRRALLDSAGVDKAALAEALGAPSGFGRSQFAFARGHAFESRVTADGGAELVRLLCSVTGRTPPAAADLDCPDTAGDGPAGRRPRTLEVLAEADKAAGEGRWTVLLHPMLELDVAGSPVCLEPDAVVVTPDAVRTVVEIKSFSILDGAADPAKVGAAARQAAVYALALAEAGGAVADAALLVCPRDFSNLPTAAPLDLRRQRATVRRQLARLTRVEEIAARLPQDVRFDPELPPEQLTAAVDAVPATYAPECQSGCDLAFHCRERAREAGEPGVLGRATRAELGGLGTIADALAAARAPDGPHAREPAAAEEPSHPADPGVDPAAVALRRAARLRAEALAEAGHATGGAA